MHDTALVTLFVIGLLGGPHCAGMCGGIVGALSLQAAPGARAWILHLAYNLGRILSYALAGALMGALGHWVIERLQGLALLLYLGASLLLIAMGLYLLGLPRFIAPLERAGTHLWCRLQPLTGHFLPVRSAAQALPLGLLWGWLPCGLVYGALASSLASGSATRGATLMLAFGLGTLPNLLLAGLLLTRFRRFSQSRAVRNIAGTLVLIFGVVGLWRGLFHGASLLAH